jgi:hypothetical protein
MKNLTIIFSLLLVSVFPGMAFSQDHFELVSSYAIEEHPGIPQSPVTYTVVYSFIACENDITLEAVTNDGVSDKVIAAKVLNKGDTLALQYITYSHISSDPLLEQDLSELPYFAEVENNITTLIFPDYNLDRMKTTTSFPVYYVDGERYEFELPPINDEDIKRFYYP